MSESKKQMIWVRVSYSEYFEIDADTPEDALRLIQDDDLFKGEEYGVDHQSEVEEACGESQL
jgi:hypothetical protein